MIRIILVFLLLSQFSFSQKLKQKVFFSENGNYTLLNELDTLDTCKCHFKNNLVLYNSKNKEEFTIIKFKDSVYFEDGTGVKGEVKLDSIACVKNSVKYKVRDTISIVSFKIFNKMTEKELYENYNLNKKGVLVNSEIKYKIDNIRDTIVKYSPDSDVIKPYELDAKIFDLTFVHNGKVFKKINPGFLFFIYQSGKDLIDYNRMNKEFEKDFKSFMRKFKKELDLCIKNKSQNNKIVDFNIFNHQKKYYFEMDYKNLNDKFLILTDRFYLSEAFENGKLKPKIHNSYSPTTWDPYSDCSFDEFFILD